MVSGSDSGLRNARTHRRALATSLRYWVGASEEPLFRRTPRHVLESAWLADGEGAGAELYLGDDTRETQWSLNLEKEAKRLSQCESSAALLWDVAGARWRPRPLGCDSRLCPVCGRTRAARACGRWRAVLEAATADGATLRHWTLTQPADSAPGGLVTGPEARRGWKGTLAADGVVARAVGGEGLGAAYRRLRATLTAARDGRRTRARWKEGLGGHLVGCEWTGRGPGGEPRWHAHAHILACTPPGVEVDEQGIIADWVRLTGGSVRAQHVRTVDADAVVEVLKYPFKPAHLTSAQRIETLAFMRGMHPHHVSGNWHPGPARRSDPCWDRWLEARPQPTAFLRLHHVDETGERRLWCGNPSQGEAEFAMRTVDGRWRHWKRDATGYAALLEDAHRSEPDLEPGTDEDGAWFADA